MTMLSYLFKKKYVIETQKGKFLGSENSELAAKIFAMQMSELYPGEQIMMRKGDTIILSLIGPTKEKEVGRSPRILSLLECHAARDTLYKIAERKQTYIKEDLIEAITAMDKLIANLYTRKDDE